MLLSSDFHKEQGPPKNSEPSNQMETVLKLDHSEHDFLNNTEGKHVLITKQITISSPNPPSTEYEDPAPTPDILSIFWSEQRQIQEQVKRVCQQGGGGLRRQINPDMFSYSREYNLLYCRNQKVLSSQHFLCCLLYSHHFQVASSTWVLKTYRCLTGLSEEEL